jgi:1-acyl-sn-glycerol-3-phosphate acyltransferase
VRGERLKEQHEPRVFVSNHQSHFDTPVVLAALGRRIRKRLVVAAAADYFYKSRPVGPLASLSLGTVPFVREGGSSRGSLELLKSLVGEGWSVLLFPSGTRGERETFKPGFAYVAVDAGADVVPLYLHGLKDTFPKGSKVPLPSGVLVGVGRTVDAGEHYDDLVQRTELEHSEIKSEVIELVKGWGG